MSLDSATTVLLFRLGVILVLYLFVLEVVRLAWRELQSESAAGRRLLPRASLEIVDAALTALTPGASIALERPVTIGREPDNDLVVDEDAVSARHARVGPRSGGWWIEDLGSTNGTWVNETAVKRRRALRPGDLIRIGRVSMRFSS